MKRLLSFFTLIFTALMLVSCGNPRHHVIEIQPLNDISNLTLTLPVKVKYDGRYSLFLVLDMPEKDFDYFMKDENKNKIKDILANIEVIDKNGNYRYKSSYISGLSFHGYSDNDNSVRVVGISLNKGKSIRINKGDYILKLNLQSRYAQIFQNFSCHLELTEWYSPK